MPESVPRPSVITDLQQVLASMHEVFIEAMNAGFNEQQAMTIVVQMCLRPSAEQ